MNSSKQKGVEKMKSVKQGRGHSLMAAIASFFMGILGIGFIAATSGQEAQLSYIDGFFMDQNPFGNIGTLGTVFAVVFTLLCFISAGYNVINAFGKNRFSAFDITTGTEEPDPLNARFGQEKEGTADKEEKNTLQEAQEQGKNTAPPAEAKCQWPTAFAQIAARGSITKVYKTKENNGEAKKLGLQSSISNKFYFIGRVWPLSTP